jgi:hypothetical protein
MGGGRTLPRRAALDQGRAPLAARDEQVAQAVARAAAASGAGSSMGADGAVREMSRPGAWTPLAFSCFPRPCNSCHVLSLPPAPPHPATPSALPRGPARLECISLVVSCLSAAVAGRQLLGFAWPVHPAVAALAAAAAAFQPNRRRIAAADGALPLLRAVAAGARGGEGEGGAGGAWTGECAREAAGLVALLDSDDSDAPHAAGDPAAALEVLERATAMRGRLRSEASVVRGAASRKERRPGSSRMGHGGEDGGGRGGADSDEADAARLGVDSNFRSSDEELETG